MSEIDRSIIDVERLDQNAMSEKKLEELLGKIKDENTKDISTREFLLAMGVTDEWLGRSISVTKEAASAFKQFANEFGIQAIACSVGSDKVVKLVVSVFTESSEIAEKIAEMKEPISNYEMELFMTTNRLHEYLMKRKEGMFAKPTVNSEAVDRMFQMWEMFPASMRGMIGILP